MTYYNQPQPAHAHPGGPTSIAATGTPSYTSFPSSSPYSVSSTQSPPREPSHLYGQTSFHHERDGTGRTTASAPGTPHQRSTRPVYQQVPAVPGRLPTSLNAQPNAGMQYPATPFPGQTMNGMLVPPGVMGMQSPMFQTPGAFYRDLDYRYHMARPEYQPELGWSGWEFANAMGGGRLERSWFDDMLQSLPTFFTTRRLSVQAARDAHRRIYHELEVDPRYGLSRFDGVNNKVLGGAAAFEAFLIWDRHHYEFYHQAPTAQNRERLIGLTMSHVYALFDRFQIPEEVPGRHGRPLRLRDAAEVAIATAKSLFEEHYTGDRHSHHSHSRDGRDDSYSSHHRGGSISDREYRREERERERDRERMMRQGGYPAGGPGSYMGGPMGGPMSAGGMPGMMPGTGYQGMPGSQGGFSHPGHHQHGGHHHHHRRDEFDSDEEDYARQRDGMYRSQYPGGQGMLGGMMNPMMAQQAAMMNGMRSAPPMSGYGAPAGAAYQQMAAMQNGMMGQPMMGQAGLMNPMMAGNMMNPAMGMAGMTGMQPMGAMPGIGMGMPTMGGQMGMGMPGMMQGNPAMYEAAQMNANLGSAQAMPGMHVRDAERMVDPAFYNGGQTGSWYAR